MKYSVCECLLSAAASVVTHDSECELHVLSTFSTTQNGGDGLHMQRKITCGSRIKFDDVHIRHGASGEDGAQDVQCGRLCTTQNRWRWTADHAALGDYAWWSHCVALSCGFIAQRFAVTCISKESCSGADITVNTAVLATVVEHWQSLIERNRRRLPPVTTDCRQQFELSG